MKNTLILFFKRRFKNIYLIFKQFGFDLIILVALKNYPKYLKNKKLWLKKNGKIDKNFMILKDYDDLAGTAKGHYFHQDLLVAKFIYENKPKRHVDVGSRIDGFVAHVASFRKIEVMDIRPLERSKHENIKFIQADLMNLQNLGEIDSISCLHVIEHFGLGRYGDPIDIDGHNKGITNLVSMLSKNGILYISFPIAGQDEVHFNANRVFQVETIFKHPSIKNNMKLIRFDYINEFGNLLTNVNLHKLNPNLNNSCGIFTFKKSYAS